MHYVIGMTCFACSISPATPQICKRNADLLISTYKAIDFKFWCYYSTYDKHILGY